MSDSILSPSSDELHSDQFVTIDALPADERAWAADFFGWDRATPIETDADPAEDQRRNDSAPPVVRFSPGVSAWGKRFDAMVYASDGRKFKAGRHPTEPEAWRAAETLCRELAADASAVA